MTQILYWGNWPEGFPPNNCRAQLALMWAVRPNMKAVLTKPDRLCM